MFGSVMLLGRARFLDCPPLTDEFRSWMAERIEKFLGADRMVEA